MAEHDGSHPPAEADHDAGENDKENAKDAKQQKGTLESIIDECIGVVKAGFNLGIAAAAPVAGYSLTGNPGVFANSASFVLGTRGRKDSKVIRNESLSGAILGTYGHYSNLPVKYMDSKLQKLAYMIPWVFGANEIGRASC